MLVSGDTSLMLAAQNGHTVAVRELLQGGADLACVDNDGEQCN